MSQGLKFARVLSLIAAFMAEAAWTRLRSRGEAQTRRRLADLVQRGARGLARALGLAVRVEREAGRGHGNALIVANHLSYLDAVALAAAAPGLFVTSLEVRDSAGLGAICRLAGCVFVERRRRESLRRDLKPTRAVLEQGLNLIVFPEATSTSGEGIRTFRPGLFQAALDAGRPVQPVCVSYERVDGERVAAHNRDLVMWYGDMAFLPHLWALCGLDVVEVRLSFSRPLRAGAGLGARELAAAAREAIEARFVPVGPAASPVPEHSALPVAA